MTYIIHPIVFYLIGLITKVDVAITFLMFGGLGVGGVLLFIAMLVNENYEDFKKFLKDFKIKTF